jgi:hypothetical protein
MTLEEDMFDWANLVTTRNTEGTDIRSFLDDIGVGDQSNLDDCAVMPAKGAPVGEGLDVSASVAVAWMSAWPCHHSLLNVR